jgi:hypothetical protein
MMAIFDILVSATASLLERDALSPPTFEPYPGLLAAASQGHIGSCGRRSRAGEETSKWV